MKRISLLFSLLALIYAPLLWAAPADSTLHQIEIRVLPESVVYSETYALGDIAELDGFDIDLIDKLSKLEIGRSPMPGRSYRISEAQVSAKLKGLIHPDQFKLKTPKNVLVSRASIKVTKEQLTEVITEEIKKNFKEYKEVNVEISSHLRDEFIPKGEASYQINRIGSPQRVGGVGSWTLRLEVDGKLYKKLIVRAKVSVIDEVVVAKGMIPQDQVIAQGDLTTLTKDISNEPRGIKRDADLVVGQQARRDISKNEAIRSHLVEEPVILEKGQPVQLVYETERLFLSNTAIALRSAKLGDVIPVRILGEHGRTIYAKVVSEKRVEVAL
ncbi:MAG: flagellar basal body P-ring formation chaperone FlgA [bacterium]|nr:flagellar basal body P-ring formation chaperone FlgA [bacterium]